MEKIELRKVRDFGAIFNDGIAFVRKNFKSFFGIILYLAGPFIILTGLISGYMQTLQTALMGNSLFNSMRFGTSSGLLNANFWGTLTIFILISMLTTLVTTACVCLYFKEYDKASPESLPIERSSISSTLAASSWRLFYNVLALGLLMGIGALILAAIFAVLFMVPVLNVLVGIALVIGCIMFLPVMIYILYVANYIVIRDEVFITVAIRKAVRYVKGNYWWTWLLMVAVLMALGVISSLFNIPITIITLMNGFTRISDPNAAGSSSVLIIIFQALSVVGQLLVFTPLFYVFSILNFHNHEERHEGTGLMGRIDEFDAPAK